MCLLLIGQNINKVKLQSKLTMNIFSVLTWQSVNGFLVKKKASVVYFDHKHLLAHAFACSKTMKNIGKSWKIPNEEPAFRCQPAFGSHSQSLTNKLFFSIFFIGLSWAFCAHDEKGTFKNDFWMFFIAHASAGRNTQQASSVLW